MEKLDALVQVMDLLARLRAVVAFLPQMPAFSRSAGHSIRGMDADLDALERELAAWIDGYMANKYKHYTTGVRTFTKADGLSGRWGVTAVRHR